MGRRDYQSRETKKPKKGSKKTSTVSILPPSPDVEVIRAKGKKAEEG